MIANLLAEDVGHTDSRARLDSDMRLKCAIRLICDSQESGSPCCEKQRTRLTNGLHILLSFPSADTQQMCQ